MPFAEMFFAFAQGFGGSTAQFLTVPYSSHSASLGGAGVGQKGVDFVFANPGALYRSYNTSAFYASGVFLSEGVFGLSGLTALRYRDQKFGFAFRYVDYGKIVGMDSEGYYTGAMYEPLELAGGFLYAMPLKVGSDSKTSFAKDGKVYLGLNVYGIYQKFVSEKFGGAADIGVYGLMRRMAEDLQVSFGLALRGVGQVMPNYHTPLNVVLGAAASKRLSSYLLRAYVDAGYYVFDSAPLINAGVEFSYRNFSVSFGYSLENSAIAFGVGYYPSGYPSPTAYVASSFVKSVGLSHFVGVGYQK